MLPSTMASTKYKETDQQENMSIQKRKEKQKESSLGTVPCFAKISSGAANYDHYQ